MENFGMYMSNVWFSFRIWKKKNYPIIVPSYNAPGKRGVTIGIREKILFGDLEKFELEILVKDSHNLILFGDLGNSNLET